MGEAKKELKIKPPAGELGIARLFFSFLLVPKDSLPDITALKSSSH